MEENIPQIFPQTSNKNALIISCNDYKRLFSGNLKHDSYFNVKGLLKCGNEVCIHSPDSLFYLLLL